MQNYIDYKCTVWFRVPFEDKDKEKVLEELQSGSLPTEIVNSDGLYLHLNEELIPETFETISVNENEGFSTIEVYENNKLIWDNSYKTEIENEKTN